MKHSANLALAYKANGFAVAAISLLLILAPSARIQWVQLLFGGLMIAHCVMGIYVDRLHGQTLRMIYQDIRDGRRPVSSYWDTALVLLMLGALWAMGLSTE